MALNEIKLREPSGARPCEYRNDRCMHAYHDVTLRVVSQLKHFYCLNLYIPYQHLYLQNLTRLHFVRDQVRYLIKIIKLD